MVSQRKQNANRQNAKNSTGPGDTRRTRFNALRHGMSAGFLSKEALIDGGPGKEDPEELEALRQAFFDYWAPEGIPEEQLVDQLVMLTWRGRRIVRHEAGATRYSQERAFANGRRVVHPDDPLALLRAQAALPETPAFRAAKAEENQAELERRQRVPSLPTAEVLERIQRYESHTSRLYDRALRQLLAVQAARRQRSKLDADNRSRRSRLDDGDSAGRPGGRAGTAG